MGRCLPHEIIKLHKLAGRVLQFSSVKFKQLELVTKEHRISIDDPVFSDNHNQCMNQGPYAAVLLASCLIRLWHSNRAMATHRQATGEVSDRGLGHNSSSQKLELTCKRGPGVLGRGSTFFGIKKPENARTSHISYALPLLTYLTIVINPAPSVYTLLQKSYKSLANKFKQE